MRRQATRAAWNGQYGAAGLRSLAALPSGYRAGARSKQRMWGRTFVVLPLLEQRGRPRGQLAEQVFPFVPKLTPRDGERFYPADSPYLATRKTVAARRRLVVNRGEIGIDRKTRRRVSAKSFELRMAGVAARPAAQHRLRQ